MLNRRLMLIAAVFMFFQLPDSYGSKVAMDYIDQYKSIAIEEMNRSGIPASIKLGQAILESNMGRSDLARKAKNHFGIKCGGWNGKGFYLKDDDRNRAGKLIKSCFRTFNSVHESYIAHTEFLKGSKSGRYDFLFEYDRTDYRAWAKGLRKAGYATDKKYPQKLIAIIEKYELYHFDSEYYDMQDDLLIVEEERTSKSRVKTSQSYLTERVDNTYQVRDYTVEKINRVSYIQAHGGESLEMLAAAIGIKTSDLMEYNEEHDYASMQLKEGERIYLQKKKRSYKGLEETHLVSENENMYSIAQLYGIKLNNLYAKNKMPKGSQPLVGETLYLQKTAPRGERPRFNKLEEVGTKEEEFLFSDQD